MPVWEGNSSSLSEEGVKDIPTILHHQKKASGNVFSSKSKSRSGWIGIHDIPA
jgi:hypothetical protein